MYFMERTFVPTSDKELTKKKIKRQAKTADEHRSENLSM